MENVWLVCRLYDIFTGTNSDTGSTWSPEHGGDVTKFTATYNFYVIKECYTEDEAKKNSKLHGFKNLINNNRYFDKIPKINSLYHFDNGIISNSKVSLSYNINNWDDFTISHETVIDKTFELAKMSNQDHCNHIYNSKTDTEPPEQGESEEPIIDFIVNRATQVTGIGVPKATIYLITPNGVTNETIVKNDETWIVEYPARLATGQIVYATQLEEGKKISKLVIKYVGSVD